MKLFVIALVMILFCKISVAKEYQGNEANVIINGAKIIRLTDNNSFPNYIQFEQNNFIPDQKFNLWINKYFKQKNKFSFVELKRYTDKIGITHIKLQQMFQNILIDNAIVTLHSKDGLINSISGTIYTDILIQNNVSINKQTSIEISKKQMNAKQYMWEDNSEENLLKTQTHNSNSTYYPTPELKIVYKDKKFKYTYNLTIYAKNPIDKKEFFVDAENGKILETRQRLYFSDVNGTAVTKYSGNQTIVTDSYSGSYRLREAGRGNGIETYNANMGTSYTSATDFTDADNYWNNINAQQDEVATDAHWASEKTYDFYYNNFAFNSIDNAGFGLLSYVHYDLVAAGYGNNVNAFWDGQRMTYGDGDATYSPLTTVDIAGHEITHGLTEFNAGLVYQDESGALNEGFSDIFGTSIEFYAKPSTANWTIGEEIGSPFRSLQDPNIYGDPDTYQGTNWYTGTGDNGGVHTNSMVIGHWYYLLVNGGTGTNDIGNNYSVTGIGITDAQAIAFRLLTVYLQPNSTYDDARYYSIQSAIDLFGPCTPQVAATTNAMYAVGLGTPYIPAVAADFSAPVTTACSVPFTVNFQNLSNNASTFLWNFGDGATSTLANPSHIYNTLGDYNVSLFADGGACGSDTIIKFNYVSASNLNPCTVILPLNGTADIQTSCSGKLFDGGGASGNYADNSDAFVTISPSGASSINLNFISFDVEPGDAGYCNYDYLEIFDGPNTSSTSLGRWCNLNGSPGNITTSGGSVTIQLHSDQGLNLSGFEMDWTCTLPNSPPVANFSNSQVTTCTGDVSFADLSTNGPSSWHWDFGDGDTSNIQNPNHTYITNGTYNVSLTVSNNFGTNTITNNNLIVVNRPVPPIVTNDTICQNDSAILVISANGTANWYDSQNGGNLIFTGTTYVTPNLATTATYFVEDAIIAVSQYGGEINSTTAGSLFTSNVSHYLIFNCMLPCKLISVEVNAGSTADRVIQLKNSSGVVLASATVNIPAGVSRINLNFDIPVGNNLQLVGPVSPNLWRNNSGCTYPYLISNLISINSSSASTNPTNYYYYFYNWEVKEPDCLSPRVPVSAIVENCTNVNSNNLDKINAYPNPFKNIIKINSDKEILNVTLNNIVGKEIICSYKKINNTEAEINTSNVSTGIYFIKVETKNGIKIKKIIKE